MTTGPQGAASAPRPRQSLTDRRAGGPSKELFTLDVDGRDGEPPVRLPVGVVEGQQDGPCLTVLGGIHGTEYAAQDAVLAFWHELDPAVLRGRVNVVLVADPLAVTARSAWTNPVDGRNIGFVWPGAPDGTITERIVHSIKRELFTGADAVIDVHGGEWDEDIDRFVLARSVGDVELDRRNLDFALALGFPLVEVVDSYGEVLGLGTGSGEAARQGLLGLTLEAGGRGRREPRAVEAHLSALRNALRFLGLIPGDPVRFAGEPVVVEHAVMLQAPATGVCVPRVRAGRWVRAGETILDVQAFDGTPRAPLTSPVDGIVMDVVVARGIREGAFAGKVGVPGRVERLASP